MRYPSLLFDLITLDLSASKIATVSAFSIHGLFRRLIMRENSISVFESNSFGHMPYLTEIDLSKNLVKELNFEEAFEFTLENLTRLDAKYNTIKSISPAFFSVFPHLTVLDLSFNHLVLISKHYFGTASGLTCLNLSNNQILTIEAGSFDRLCALKRLNLGNNLVYDLTAGLFSDLSQLEELDLSRNKLESVEKLFFAGLSSLKRLDLSQNLVKTLQDNSFECVNRLETLALSSNRIQTHRKALESFENLSRLDVSFSQISGFSTLNSMLTSLDLSSNALKSNEVDLAALFEIRCLNLSRTSAEFILAWNYSFNPCIVELDLSYNDLSTQKDGHFLASLVHLRKLYMRATSLTDFEFLYSLAGLESVDLSENRLAGGHLDKIQYASVFRELHVSNVSLASFLSLDFMLAMNAITLTRLDVSSNQLTHFSSVALHNAHLITSLDVSHNALRFIFTSEPEIKQFLTYYVQLTVIDMRQSFTAELSHKIFYFGPRLQQAYLSQNNLAAFPRFCQHTETETDFGVECQLKVVFFDSNSLTSVHSMDLADLSSLEYLNLENNCIDFIEAHAFYHLSRLETLVLSRNKLSLFANDSAMIFSKLNNLKHLNLSCNVLDIITSRLFDNLLKLETLDLSKNMIRILEDFAFNKLNSLRNLHLNDNGDKLHIGNQSFTELASIQDIQISKSILTRGVKSIFVDLFTQMNRNASRHNQRVYFRSLSLIAAYSRYDCALALDFMENMVHFNFKTEREIHDYFAECSDLAMLHVDTTSHVIANDHRRIVDRYNLIFSNFFFDTLCALLIFILIFGFYLNAKNITIR